MSIKDLIEDEDVLMKRILMLKMCLIV